MRIEKDILPRYRQGDVPHFRCSRSLPQFAGRDGHEAGGREPADHAHAVDEGA